MLKLGITNCPRIDQKQSLLPRLHPPTVVHRKNSMTMVIAVCLSLTAFGD